MPEIQRRTEARSASELHEVLRCELAARFFEDRFRTPWWRLSEPTRRAGAFRAMIERGQHGQLISFRHGSHLFLTKMVNRRICARRKAPDMTPVMATRGNP